MGVPVGVIRMDGAAAYPAGVRRDALVTSG
jgi:hypothetical protein